MLLLLALFAIMLLVVWNSAPLRCMWHQCVLCKGTSGSLEACAALWCGSAHTVSIS